MYHCTLKLYSNTTEENFSQLEQECSAIVHECDSLGVYILGGHFEIITDHKSLVHLFKNAQSRMPLQFERCSLRQNVVNSF